MQIRGARWGGSSGLSGCSGYRAGPLACLVQRNIGLGPVYVCVCVHAHVCICTASTLSAGKDCKHVMCGTWGWVRSQRADSVLSFSPKPLSSPVLSRAVSKQRRRPRHCGDRGPDQSSCEMGGVTFSFLIQNGVQKEQVSLPQLGITNCIQIACVSSLQPFSCHNPRGREGGRGGTHSRGEPLQEKEWIA